MEPAALRVVFFDLGDTLVARDPAAPGRYRWLPGARETLRKLSRAGLRVGVISNTGSLDRAALRALLPADFEWGLFDSPLVILSSEVGLEKPDPRIFRLALQRAQEQEDLRLDPPECLFCGESLVESLAAQHVGMRSARLTGTPAQADIGQLGDRLRDANLLH